MNLKRQTFTISCTNLSKKERMTKYGNLSPQNKKHFLLRKYHVTLARTKAVTYSSQSLFNFLSRKLTLFFQLPAFYFVHPCSTKLQTPQINWLAPITSILARVKTDPDKFLGPKLTPAFWILN